MSLSLKLIKQFNGFKLDIEFSMGSEILVLFGHSGSGKSVTLKLIAGLLAPDDGYLKLYGKELFNNSGKITVKPQERSIGYVFQNHSIFPHMTIKDNIVFGAKGLEKNKALTQTEEMLCTFNLSDVDNKYPHEISGGQQQRVALAMSLIRKPKALLLDEPFSALDNPLRTRMRVCLKNVMKKLNIPIILVTHDSTEALSMADRILIYKNGSIAQQIIPSPEINQTDLEKAIR